MIDCLLIGFNDPNLEDTIKLVKTMGVESGPYRDLNLAFVEHAGKPYRALDILTHWRGAAARPFHNADFLWPVISYLGSYLTRHGLQFDYVNLFHLEKERLREKLAQDILAIAVTTTLYVIPQPILEIISFIRQYNQTAKIVVGGPYILNQARGLSQAALQEHLEYLGADVYVISQEGEAALVKLLRALQAGADLDAVENIAYKAGGRYTFTAKAHEENLLEENPVNYSLFSPDRIGQFVSVRTAKSCPFACAFCGFPQRAGKYKYLSVEQVERELDAIRNASAATTLTILDDTFNVPLKRFKEILRMMIRNRYGFKWNCFYRCDHGDQEAIQLMKKAGCEGVFLGVESGSDSVLARMNKTARRQDFLKAIPLLREAGIVTHANLVVGFPGETLDTVQETIDLLEQARPDFFRAQLWYCDPATPVWDKRDEYGIKGSAFSWSHNTLDAHTACDLIEKMFLCVENALWLPQQGFELWSVFYLQRRGMSLEQVKTFIRCFNALIKARLLCPDRPEGRPDLTERLKASCLFDTLTRPDMRPVDGLSGARYLAAERFWRDEFGAGLPAPNAALLRAPDGPAGDGWASLPCVSDPVVSARLQAEGPAGLLAACGALLSRLSGREEVGILSAGPDGQAVPLKLYPAWNQSLEAFAGHVARKLAQATEHRPYAFHILNAISGPDGLGPVFDVACLWDESQEALTPERLWLPPAVKQGLGLVLAASHKQATLALRLWYKQDWFKPETAETLTTYLARLLYEAGRNPGALLGEIALEDRQASPPPATEADEFNF